MDYGYFPLFKKKKEGNGAGELSVFCQSYFNKTLIGQAGSIGGKARQEVGVEQRDWEYSGKQEAPRILMFCLSCLYFLSG